MGSENSSWLLFSTPISPLWAAWLLQLLATALFPGWHLEQLCPRGPQGLSFYKEASIADLFPKLTHSWFTYANIFN